MSILKDALSPLQIFLQAADAGTSPDNLAEAARKARLNPIVMVDQTLLRQDLEIIHSINQVHLSIYSAMYLMAFGLGQEAEKGVTVEQLISPYSDNFNPARDLPGDLNSAIDRLTSRESLDEESWMKESGSLMEDFTLESFKEIDVAKPGALAVGKVISVPVGDKTLPIQAIINPMVMDPVYMSRVLKAYIGKDNSIIGRWHRYQAGEINSLLEWATGWDIIEEQRKLDKDDTDGILAMIRKGRKQGVISSIVGAKRRVNAASHIVMMSKQSAQEFERSMRGKFSRPRDREKFFDTTGTMLLTVVDNVRGTVQIFTRGVDQSAIYTFDELKPAASNAGFNDISAMMKAFKEGANFVN